jgi:hypothetical protein
MSGITLDKQFLDFWGNFLLAAAKGQGQIEEFSRWLSQGMRGFRELTAMFQQCYGLGSDRSGEAKDWETARHSFETAFRAYLDALGCVPKSDYIALKTQLQELKQRAEQQEAALHTLRRELGESRMAQGDVVRGFQDLIQVQSEQFEEFTASISRLFTGGGSSTK